MSRSNAIRILYIEDDLRLAALVKLQLSRAGYTVDLVHDGEQGLAKCAAGGYDLVAVDHSLPLRDGLDVIRTLASQGPLPPTIMITGHGSEKVAVETMKLGADDYIVKDLPGGWLDLLPGVIERVLTRRRLVEEKKRAAEQLGLSEKRLAEAEKLAATGRMAASVAHEINNPLAGIKNAFLLIKDAVPKDHPDYQFVGRIEKEIDRIARIVRHMLKLYSPVRGPLSEISIDEVIHDVVFMLQPSYRKHGVTIEVDAPDPGVGAKLPEGVIRQVLYNLVTNAIEASPQGGEVKITARIVENTLRITVKDEGCGIPVGVQNRIFEPFFTTKGSATSGGIGLGLGISKRAVEALGGSLEFESIPGKGTVFQVVLPV
jgi:signal transduction histidine kinase